ncbi:MAG: NADPH-dependent F420 reductase [Ferrimicrobium sp.]|uniref:NADPH-dependent F420 reductase n=1 Tax=Ferrimicrobium sp. TaxID=2926050 RepID=UPI0026097FD1|nr:NADPH-dependent F420 reductase [Ferrimicrobium sp.]
MQIGILGGTGPLGSALGARLAASHLSVGLGSRDRTKAVEVAKGMMGRWPEVDGYLVGADNEEVARAQMVFVAVPWEATIRLVEPLEHVLEGKIVVSMANALVKVGDEFAALTVPRGSAAQLLQARLPAAMVVAALHHVPARSLANLSRPVEVDTLVCADSSSARSQVAVILSRIPGLRVLEAGSLAQAPAIEAMTAVLLNINLRYKATASIRLTGVEVA